MAKNKKRDCPYYSAECWDKPCDAYETRKDLYVCDPSVVYEEERPSIYRGENDNE